MAAKRAMYNFTIRDPKAREREGHSIFYKDPSSIRASRLTPASGTVVHTYSCYDRGNDKLNLHYHYLDLVPKGRNVLHVRARIGYRRAARSRDPSRRPRQI
jgi:predicted dithiol-disulfide oxidoreductase (DUF899 family)